VKQSGNKPGKASDRSPKGKKHSNTQGVQPTFIQTFDIGATFDGIFMMVCPMRSLNYSDSLAKVQLVRIKARNEQTLSTRLSYNFNRQVVAETCGGRNGAPPRLTADPSFGVSEFKALEEPVAYCMEEQEHSLDRELALGSRIMLIEPSPRLMLEEDKNCVDTVLDVF
jgi:hypothetical protein